MSASGGIVSGTPAGVLDVSAANLSASAAAGIGSATPLKTAVTNLAFHNTGANVGVANTGALTINAVGALSTSSNTGVATTLTAASPMTFAVNTTSAGTLTATTTETGSETVTPLGPPDDDLTVNSGVTVESTGGNVNLTSGDSIVLQAGSLVKSDVGTITLMAGVGDVDNDAQMILLGTLQGANVTINSPSDVCVGTITSAGTVSITSTTGAILDCNDPPTGTLNITANKLALSAITGIGVSSASPLILPVDAPLETQVSNLEAATVTGGIFIVNTGDLTIGNVTPTLLGVRANASGDISITNAGSITINQGGNEDVVAQNGNITLTANGATANINTGGGDPSPLAAIRTVATGNISLTAGQDVHLGDPATVFGNVRSIGDVTINAGRDFIVDEDSFLDAGAAGAAGSINATAGRNISLLHNVAGGALIRVNGTGTINLTTGTNGVFTADTAGGPGVVTAGGGDINISADNMTITATPISAGTGVVRLQQVSGGQTIDVGGADAAGTLGLTNAELGNVSGRVLVIGRNDPGFFGPINVTNTIAINPSNVHTLVLRGNSTIIESGAGAISVLNLAVQSAGFTSLDGDNSVTTLAGRNLGPNSQLSFTEAPNTPLTIGTVDVADPIGFPVGLAGFVSQNGNIIITSDNLTISQPVGAGSGCVILLQRTATNTIDVGGPDVAGVLGLDQSDLSQITAAGLRIGRFDGNSIVVTAPITLSTAAAPPAVGVNTLELVSVHTVTETGAGALSVNTLAVAANDGAALDGANDLRFVGAFIPGSSFSITNTPSAGNPTGKLTISNVTACGGVFNGITALGDVTITADDLDITAPISAAGFCVTLQPFSAAQNVTVGTEPGGTLGLDQYRIESGDRSRSPRRPQRCRLYRHAASHGRDHADRYERSGLACRRCHLRSGRRHGHGCQLRRAGQQHG